MLTFIRRTTTILVFSSLALIMGCASSPAREDWAIAIHAGAGVISKDTPVEEVATYKASLAAALDHGRAMLASGATAMDTVESVVEMLENNPLFNAGKGAVYNAEGGHELDSSIMDGSTLGCGAVAGVTTVKNPIHLARRVMEKTPHVLLSGAGAEAFADTQSDIARVSQDYFHTEKRLKSLKRVLRRQAKEHSSIPQPSLSELKSTVGCVVLDLGGNLAAATSTGGMTAKRFGRVGDSPIIGAGTYAANDTCAVSCTGTGEEYIRHGVARDVADRMRYLGVSLEKATKSVIFDVLKAGDGGLISVDRRGNIALTFNTLGMFRAWATASGPNHVAIW